MMTQTVICLSLGYSFLKVGEMELLCLDTEDYPDAPVSRLCIQGTSGWYCYLPSTAFSKPAGSGSRSWRNISLPRARAAGFRRFK